MITNRILVSTILLSLLSLAFDCNKKTEAAEKNEYDEIIKKIQNRKKYTGFTQQTLKSIPDADLEQALIDYLFDYKLGTDYEKIDSIVKTQSLGFQYLYVTWVIDGEVNNGGFNQYFYNQTDKFIPLALDACAAFKSPEMANVIKGAHATFIEEEELHSKVSEAKTMESFMDSYKETKLDKWDKLFYKVEPPFLQKRLKYIRSHLKDFITSK